MQKDIYPGRASIEYFKAPAFNPPLSFLLLATFHFIFVQYILVWSSQKGELTIPLSFKENSKVGTHNSRLTDRRATFCKTVPLRNTQNAASDLLLFVQLLVVAVRHLSKKALDTSSWTAFSVLQIAQILSFSKASKIKTIENSKYFLKNLDKTNSSKWTYYQVHNRTTLLRDFSY